MRIWFLTVVLSVAGCMSAPPSATRYAPGEAAKDTNGGGTTAPGDGSSDAGAARCATASECGLGRTCRAGDCVDLPPEQHSDPAGTPPVASPHDVWAIANDSDVARINIASRAVDVATVPAGVKGLAALPDVDAAVALSPGSQAIVAIEDVGAPRVQPLGRDYDTLTLSPDGSWALAWSRSLSGTPSGISTAALVDVAALRAGTHAVYERASGYRTTDAFFRVQNGKAIRAALLAKDGLNIFDLQNLAAQALPQHVALPADVSADVTARSALPTPDGRFLILRANGSTALTAIDLDAAPPVAVKITLPGAPTDLAVSADGTQAVAVLRSEGKVIIAHLPADLTNAAGLTIIDAGGRRIGQAVLSGGSAAAGLGPYALLFTGAEAIDQLTRLDLASGTLIDYALPKSVAAVAASPDGRTVVVIHQAESNSSATDPYERQVALQQGYSLLDVNTGLSALQLTGEVHPRSVVFAAAEGFAALLLVPTSGESSVAALDLRSLVARPIGLESPALFLGPIPPVPGDPASGRGVFVSQEHAAGRISFLALDSLAIQTVTGFELNGQIGQ